MSLDPSLYSILNEHITEQVAVDSDHVKEILVALAPLLERYEMHTAMVALGVALLYSIENETCDEFYRKKNTESLLRTAGELLRFWRKGKA